MHFHAEMMANGWEIEEPCSPEFQQANMIYDQLLNMGLRPYRTEASIFHSGLRLAGQIDLLLQDAEGRLVIADWKRVKEIKTDSSFGHLIYPLDHLPDANYWKYALQLNVTPPPKQSMLSIFAKCEQNLFFV